jgi:glycerol-1-phosphate dehydrogenase [NAD(P)+]
MSNPATKLTLAEALRSARETKALEIGEGILLKTPQVFRAQFGDQPAVLVADENTFAVAGQKVLDAFRAAKHPISEPFIFRDPSLYAEFRFIEQLEAALKQHSAIPVAVGSGTINDLTKLVSHRLERPYMCVATAASMDGYTAFGASITHQGAKQTFLCPAPVAVVADLNVICAAPGLMNSWGYADLLAKVPAGADWILADALGVEPIHAQAWAIVQGRLREMVSDPAGVLARDPQAVGRLMEGLLLGGFAMQSAQSSRPASGAEHQFSHLWDNQHHTHNGQAPSHGFKVAIGTLATTALFEFLLEQPLERVDVDVCCAVWPDVESWSRRARELLGDDNLAALAKRELSAKHSTPEQLRAQLQTLRAIWPELRQKLRARLLPLDTLKQMLRAAGAPTEPEHIGITRERLRRSYWQSFCIRRRFNLVDLAVRTGLLEAGLKQIFGPTGPWPITTCDIAQAAHKA